MVAVGIVIGAFVTLVIFSATGSVSADSVGFWSEAVGFSVFEFSSLYSPFVRVKRQRQVPQDSVIQSREAVCI